MDEIKKPLPMGGGAERRQGCRSARIVHVIAVETVVGKGTERDPNRIITEYWSTEGKLLAVSDPEFNPFENQISCPDSDIMLYQKIVELCEQRGTNVSKLERECGLANGTIRRWKDSSPSIENLIKVADKLDVSLDYLGGRTGENSECRPAGVSACE